MTRKFLSQNKAIGDVLKVLDDRTMAQSLKVCISRVGPLATEG